MRASVRVRGGWWPRGRAATRWEGVRRSGTVGSGTVGSCARLPRAGLVRPRHGGQQPQAPGGSAAQGVRGQPGRQLHLWGPQDALKMQGPDSGSEKEKGREWGQRQWPDVTGTAGGRLGTRVALGVHSRNLGLRGRLRASDRRKLPTLRGLPPRAQGSSPRSPDLRLQAQLAKQFIGDLRAISIDMRSEAPTTEFETKGWGSS